MTFIIEYSSSQYHSEYHLSNDMSIGGSGGIVVLGMSKSKTTLNTINESINQIL